MREIPHFQGEPAREGLGRTQLGETLDVRAQTFRRAAGQRLPRHSREEAQAGVARMAPQGHGAPKLGAGHPDLVPQPRGCSPQGNGGGALRRQTPQMTLEESPTYRGTDREVKTGPRSGTVRRSAGR